MHRPPPIPTLLAVLLVLPGRGPESLRAAGDERTPATDGSSAWQVETLAGVESLPAAELGGLTVAPASGPGAKGTWKRGAKELPLDEVLFLRAPRLPPADAALAPPAGMLILLREGGELRARVVAPRAPPPGADAGERVTLECRDLGEEPVTVALDSVLALIPSGPAHPGGEPALLETIEAARGARAKKDIAWLAGETRVEGILEAFEPDGARFSSDAAGQDVKIPYAKLRAVILAALDDTPGAAGAPSRDIRVVLGEGSALPLRLLGIDRGALRAAHAALGQLEVRLESVREIGFLSGRVSYLSDREPLRAREVIGAAFRSAAELRLGHKRDRNVLGGPIRLGEREHPKGLGVHSYSLLEYDLGGGFQRFQSVIGLDRCARPPAGATGTEARVVFRVILDGKPALEKPMTWQDPPAAIDVQLGSARVLGLEVDYGEASDARSFLNAALDRADWADARLVK